MSSLFVAVLIVRSSDKFRLCSVVDAGFQQAKGQAAANALCREHVDRILERMQAKPGILSFDSPEVTYFVLSGDVVTVVVAANKGAPAFMAGGSDVVEGVTCALLEEIESEFIAQHATQTLLSASRPFQFMSWDRALTKLLRKSTLSLSKHTSNGHHAAGGSTLRPRTVTSSNNPTSNAAYDALQKELQDVHVVMKQNLDDILTRGESLETVSHYTQQLKDGSQTYYKRTVHLNRMRVLKTYGPPLAVGLLLMLWLWFYYL